jgi:hypothetical protein
MNKWEIDVPVLIIFFVRDEQLRQTFEQVKKARPRVLLLWQDGPRANRSDDLEGIRKCREIVENIDWECDVYRNYHEENMGCDPSTFLSHKWAFSIVDRCIILEDDVKVSQSFFTFCKELLDRYENDQRINRICGMNTVGVSEDCPYDYFFSSVGSVWGWATWKRVADEWDENYTFLDDKYEMKLLSKMDKSSYYKKYVERTRDHRASGKQYWETIHTYNILLNSRLNIVPTKNMVCNTGLDVNSTHAMSEIKLVPRAKRKLYYMNLNELEFPLKHPKHIVNNVNYVEENERLMGIGHPFVRFYRRCESVFLKIRYGRFDSLKNAVIRRVKRIRMD